MYEPAPALRAVKRLAECRISDPCEPGVDKRSGGSSVPPPRTEGGQFGCSAVLIQPLSAVIAAGATVLSASVAYSSMAPVLAGTNR